jgi:nucleotide-binding universal stress UspA family protein
VWTKRSFGVSTHLYQSQRLTRDHLAEVKAAGFDTTELFATRRHLDYHNPAVVADLQQWLAEAGVELRSVHAPVAEGVSGGRLDGPLNLASADVSARAQALAEAERALQIARRIPYGVFVVHLGVPRTLTSGPVDSTRDAARRSVEALQQAAEPLGVRVAIEVIPYEMSKPGSIVHFIENVVDAAAVGNLPRRRARPSRWRRVMQSRRSRNTSWRSTFTTTTGVPTSIWCRSTFHRLGGVADGAPEGRYDGTMMLEIGPRGSTRETLTAASKLASA